MKTKTVFACQNCGYQSPKWLGKCPDCDSWNSLIEEKFTPPSPGRRESLLPLLQERPVLLKEVQVDKAKRLTTDLLELDRVLGGGIVCGSVVLIGGDPGIGKSTISLQVSNRLATKGHKVLYVSGEESIAQTKLRAERLGADSQEKLYIVNQTDLSLIEEYIGELSPEVVIVDSIQVLFDPSVGSAAGSVSQVRECAGRLTRLAKSSGVSVFIIGHVTKEGTLAGPRLLEHIVDTVLYFEGDRFSSFRILRAVKNRFGTTNEVGVFQMGPAGLEEVANPSEIFLGERSPGSTGSAVASVTEGTRTLLVEVQALVSRSGFGYPLRKCQGFDQNRLNMLVAVLEKRIGLNLAQEDIFLNVAGGIKVDDPAADMAVAAAVTSSFRDIEVPADTMLLGEIGLAGELRSISHSELRLNEAHKLGFKRCLLPERSLKGLKSHKAGLEIISASTLKSALDLLLFAKGGKSS